MPGADRRWWPFPRGPFARSRRGRRSGDLASPAPPRRVLPLRPEYDADAFGRAAEAIARFIGTAKFLAWQTVVIVAWVIWNAIPGVPKFDPYPFLFLTLGLSLQAAYAAPLILLAQNRQDDRDRVNLGEDRKVNSRQVSEIEYLSREVADVRILLGEVVTRDYLRSELRAALEDFDGTGRGDGGRGDGGRGDAGRGDAGRGDTGRGDTGRGGDGGARDSGSRRDAPGHGRP